MDEQPQDDIETIGEEEIPAEHPDLVKEQTGVDPTDEPPNEDPGQLG